MAAILELEIKIQSSIDDDRNRMRAASAYRNDRDTNFANKENEKSSAVVDHIDSIAITHLYMKYTKS